MNLVHEISGAAFLIMLFLSVLGLAETLTRRGMLAAEPARKTVHLAGGLGCLLFPILIDSWVTVLCLALVFVIVFFMGENLGMLRSLSSVERKSCGSLLFPIAILALFIISNGRLWLYVASLLVLVLADTAAALAGTRFGRTFFETIPGERKSLEGTFMFALVGFFAVYLVLLIFSDIPNVTCMLTALLMSLLLAGLEAISIGGTDNLFVPLGTCFLLLRITTKPPLEILFQCLSFVGIAALVFLLNQRFKTFRTRPLIIFILASYSAWALGSAEWMIPVIVGFFIYNWICTPCEPLPTDLTARRLLRPMYPLLAILFAANARGEFNFWFGPFLAATATSTSLCIESRFRRNLFAGNLRGSRLAATLLLPSTLSLLLCLPSQGWRVLSIAPATILLCSAIPFAYFVFKRSTTQGFPWSYAITLYAASSALVYAALQQTGVIEPMKPLTWMEVFR